MSFFENSVFFGVTISIVAYGVGCVLKDKLKMDIFNPVLISIVAVIAVLACAHIDYDKCTGCGKCKEVCPRHVIL